MYKIFNVEPHNSIPALNTWELLSERYDKCNKITPNSNPVRIALVGKYTNLSDSYHSVLRALQHAAMEIDVNKIILSNIYFFLSNAW
jgi:CTP synthase